MAIDSVHIDPVGIQVGRMCWRLWGIDLGWRMGYERCGVGRWLIIEDNASVPFCGGMAEL